MGTVKQKYEVDLISNILNYEKKFNVISTFSGGGGSCLGYMMAGGDVLVASEFVEEAYRTYSENFPSTHVLTDDIRNTKPEYLLELAGVNKYDLDIFDGSPPCSAFSTAGSREKGWGKAKNYSNKKQVVDDLFFEYLRLLKGIMPKTFVVENVSGLTMGNAKGYLKEIVNMAKDIGYNVKCRLMNSVNYGVPQRRIRLIIIGTRNDLNIKPIFPESCENKYTLYDAIHTIKNHTNIDISGWKSINNEIKKLKTQGMKSSKFFQLARPYYNRPAPTLVANASGSQWIHPIEDRPLSIEERMRVQSLPDDYKLTGTPIQKAERIGRMVPPLMMKHIANTLYEKVLKNV